MEDISAGSVHLHRQKRHLQGASVRLPPTTWGSTSWSRAAPSSMTQCSAPLSRSWVGTSSVPPSPASWVRSARLWPPETCALEQSTISDGRGAGNTFTHTAKPADLQLLHQPLHSHRQHLRRRPPVHLRQPLLHALWAGRTIHLPDLMRYKYEKLRAMEGKGERHRHPGQDRHPLRAERCTKTCPSGTPSSPS